jgi:hypothetical protein
VSLATDHHGYTPIKTKHKSNPGRAQKTAAEQLSKLILSV